MKGSTIPALARQTRAKQDALLKALGQEEPTTSEPAGDELAKKPDDAPVTWGELRQVTYNLVRFAMAGLNMTVSSDKDERAEFSARMAEIINDLGELGALD